jgi:D-alanyl-lipoteichoic acid acyltransferase DltB (MBOAT superfamily)
MPFNSIDFAIFLSVVFILYWFVTNKNLKIQNLFIIAASYLFYGWWDWRFLLSILFITIVDYFVGLGLSREKNEAKRKILFYTGILVNLGFLGFFKYYNFFLDNFVTAFSFLGVEIKAQSLKIILPVGISFYTFKMLSYIIDVYKKQLEPATDFLAYSAFVSFFPQLVAGPIDRGTTLLPQFYRERVFDYNKAVDGLRQTLWGLFKKMVIADNCAEYANLIFNNSTEYPGSILLLGVFFFAFQIYGDFSGYSDIAIGISRLFGFDLMKNFAFPYFSRDIAEFWRRWHISLSNWLRDYVFFPLRRKLLRQKGLPGWAVQFLPPLVTMLVSGIWHGANWTFVIWGALHGVYLIVENSLEPVAARFFENSRSKIVSGLYRGFQIGFTFALICFGWIFFRADNVAHAISILVEIFSGSLILLPYYDWQENAKALIILIMFFIWVEWLGKEDQYAVERLGLNWPKPVRWAFYSSIIFLIGMFVQTTEVPFIYFRF